MGRGGQTRRQQETQSQPSTAQPPCLHLLSAYCVPGCTQMLGFSREVPHWVEADKEIGSGDTE